LSTTFPSRLVACIASLALGPALSAQSLTDSAAAVRALASAASPTACVEAVGKLTDASFGEYNAASKRGDGEAANKAMDAVMIARSENARRCAQRFPIAKVGPDQVAALIELYGMAESVDSIANVVERMALLDLTTTQRLDALWKAFDGVMPSPPGVPTARGIELGQKLAKELDALGASGAPKRVTAHARLVRWTSPGSDAQLQHAERAVTAARSVSTDSAKARGDAIGEAYVAASEAEGFAWRFDRAAAKAKEGAALLSETHRRKKELEFMARRYDLVGKRAPTIQGQYWLNASENTKQVDFTAAKVTMLGFASVSCMVCRQGYPVVLNAKEKLGKGFQPILVAQLEGEPSGATRPTPDQEVAYGKKYWVDRHSIDFPIAIVETPVDKDGEYQTPQIFKDYGLQFYPMYVFVDQAGIVRYVQRGNGPDLGGTIERVMRRVTGGEKSSTP
jgi:hypothetical protein